MKPNVLARAAALCSFLAAGARDEVSGAASNAVVEIRVTYQEYDQQLPWRRTPPQERQGYGVMVAPSLALTTEHMVRNERFIELRQPRRGERLAGRLEAADSDVNLALVRVDLPAQAGAVAAAPLADRLLPAERVTVLQLDATQQIQAGPAEVVEVSVTGLPHAPSASLTATALCDLRIDGEGAPVFKADRLAGLIMNYDARARTAQVLPSPVIGQFLGDAAEPPYEGFASAGFSWTALVDPVERRFLGVNDSEMGVQVLACAAGTGAGESLRPQDVILEWDGHAVDKLGFYDDPEYGRLSLPHLIRGRRRPGDTALVRVVRDSAEQTVQVRLARWSPDAGPIPEDVTGGPPPYLMEAGFVLRELTGRYLRALDKNLQGPAVARLWSLYVTRKDQPAEAGERVVIVSAVLSDPINLGYQEFANEIVTAVNGRPVSSLDDTFRIVDEDGGIRRMKLQSLGVELVIDPEEHDAANRRLGEQYRIPAPRFQPAVHE